MARRWITSVSALAMAALLAWDTASALANNGCPGFAGRDDNDRRPPIAPAGSRGLVAQSTKTRLNRSRIGRRAWSRQKALPNNLRIMTDGMWASAAPSTFGGVIPTPALDKIAAMGLRYTNFHTTSLCSPTRAALITGRNHHSVGFGVISEQSTGFPGYNSIIPKDATTIGRILLENGYRTSWFGKDHNTPAYAASQAGPFDQWPIGMGFEYFYGFVGGDTSQWDPGNLFRNTTPIHPYVGHPDWNLTTAEADDADPLAHSAQRYRSVDAVFSIFCSRRHPFPT